MVEVFIFPSDNGREEAINKAEEKITESVKSFAKALDSTSP
jgi:hypothetical protein